MKKFRSFLGLTLAGYLILNPLSVYALGKNETVYTSLDENGNIIISSVTNHIKVGNETKVEDDTELKNILNINGKETFTLDKNTLKWNAAGRDIFYQGEIEKEQPIDVSIEYYLDGKKMKVKDMIGKKGTVKIVLHYQNKLANQVKINGKNETIYTPFVVTTGLVLHNDCNKNIKVENGRSVDSGSRTMVIGVSAPGLYESMKMEELKGLDTVTITYETTQFSLGSIYVIATPKMLEEKDLEIFDRLNLLTSNMNTLQSSMNQIEEGAKKLETGSASLTVGAKEISNNLNTVTKSITQLKNGSVGLKEGLTNMIIAIDGAINQIESGLQVTNMEEVKQKLTGLKNQNMAAITSLVPTGMTVEQLLTYTGTDLQVLQAKQLVTLLSMDSQIIDQMTISLDSLPMLKEGLVELKNGSATIEYNLGLLEEGTKKLAQGASTLSRGTEDLNRGVTTLSNGIIQMNEKGIHPLYHYSNLVHAFNTRVEAMTNLSKEYHGYATSNASETLFVYMIKGIK